MSFAWGRNNAGDFIWEATYSPDRLSAFSAFPNMFSFSYYTTTTKPTARIMSWR
jgi:hypothetical protein